MWLVRPTLRWNVSAYHYFFLLLTYSHVDWFMANFISTVTPNIPSYLQAVQLIMKSAHVIKK